MRMVTISAIVTTLFISSGGCEIGVRAGDRTFELHQMERVGDPSDAFLLDISHRPNDAVERRTDEMSCSGPVTKIELRRGYPVRVVLLPATQP
jgi:hypothetical protein